MSGEKVHTKDMQPYKIIYGHFSFKIVLNKQFAGDIANSTFERKFNAGCFSGFYINSLFQIRLG